MMGDDAGNVLVYQLKRDWHVCEGASWINCRHTREYRKLKNGQTRLVEHSRGIRTNVVSIIIVHICLVFVVRIIIVHICLVLWFVLLLLIFFVVIAVYVCV